MITFHVFKHVLQFLGLSFNAFVASLGLAVVDGLVDPLHNTALALQVLPIPFVFEENLRVPFLHNLIFQNMLVLLQK